MFALGHDVTSGAQESRTSPALSAPAIPSTVVLLLLLVILTGLTASRNRIYESPVALWKSAIEDSPNKRRTRQNYAHALLTVGIQEDDSRLYWQALSEFKTVVNLPDDGGADMRNFYLDMGLIHYHLHLEEDAVRTWREGLEYFPTDAALKSNLAFALFRMGRLGEAIGFALEARQNDPRLAEGAHALAWIYWERGEYQKAAEQFTQYLELRPEVAIGYWNAAVAFERAGNYLQAREMAVRYLDREVDPGQLATARSFLDDISAARPAQIK